MFEIEMENISGTLTICLPYEAIEPVIPKLKAQFQSEKLEVDHVWVRRLRAELLSTDIEIIAELGTTEITPEDLMGFKVGDTLILGNDVTDPLILKVEGNPKFKGFPGVSRGNKAIQITEVIEREG
jgi:flagellar motor switch protein FliM